MNSNRTKNNTVKILFLILSFIMAVASKGENTVRHLDTTNGLPDNYVKWVIKDSQGYMWFATLNGLSRWDGYNFRIYRIEHLGGYNDDVQWVAEDGNGNIWVGNPYGIFAYDKIADCMIGDITRLLTPLGIKNKPYALSIDGEHNLWCASGDTLYFYDFHSRRLNTFTLPHGHRLLDAKSCAGLKYVMLEGGRIYSVEDGRLKKLNVNLPANDRSRCIFIDQTRRLWLFSIHGQGLKRIDGNKCVTVLDSELITNVTSTPDGKILVATDNKGLLHINDDGSVETHIQLPDNHVNDAYIDNSGILWICTAKQGVFFCSTTPSPFEIHYLAKDMDVKCVDEDENGTLWMGCDGAGLLIDDKNYRAPQLGLPSDMIVCHHKDYKGRTWYGTFNGGVFYRNNDERKFTPFGDNRLNSVRRIITDDTGTIWFATFEEGLYGLAPDGKIKWYHMDNCELNNNSVMDMAYHGGRTLYVGTSSGLYTLDIYERKFTKIDNIGEHYITSLAVDHKQQVWVGTRSGVSILTPNLKVIKHIGAKDGLPNTWARSLIEDSMGRIWMATDNGLVCFGSKISVFTKENGVGDFRFNTHSSTRLKDGRLLFGAQGGYVLVDPLLINNQLDSSSLYVKITSGADKSGNIVIGYDDTNYTVEVSNLDFNTLHHAAYEYRIGENGEWNCMNGNKIMFNRMAPGSYKLQIRMAGDDNAPITTAQIKVTPPWWRSWWAYLIYSCIITLVIGSLFRFLKAKNAKKLEVQQLQLAAKHQHEIDKAKLKFFTNISHDLRTPLSLIISPLERLLSSESDNERLRIFELMHRNAMVLLDEVNQLLEYRKIGYATPRLNLSYGDLTSFVKQTCLAFMAANIREDVTVRQGVIVDSVYMDFDKDKMQRILLNLLSNAIKYNVSGGSVSVDLITSKDDMVELKISDTGIGIDPEHRKKIFDRFYRENDNLASGNGIGLHIVKEYVTLHHGTIEVKNNHPQGSVFIVKLPISKSSTINATIKPTESLDKEKPTLLIVEDNNDFRYFMASTLSVDYNVIQAINGKDALQKLKDADFNVDIVVSDVMMPEMDGMELCRAIKTDLQSSHIPFVMLTARSSEEHIVNGLQEGADDYMMKPFNIDIFKLRLTKLMERSQSNRLAFSRPIDVEPSQVTITSLDEQFIEQALQVVEKHINDTDFGVETMASEMGVSRSNLYKKLNVLTGTAPLEFIRTIRLKRGRQILEKGGIPVSQVAYAVGMSPKIFAKYFRDLFGCLPSEYHSNKNDKPDSN